MAQDEVGNVAMLISHIGDMHTLFEGIPLGEMNTLMTSNATAVWLMALYVAAAEEQGFARAKLKSATQNDIIKDYQARGSYVFPPTWLLRLTQRTCATDSTYAAKRASLACVEEVICAVDRQRVRIGSLTDINAPRICDFLTQ